MNNKQRIRNRDMASTEQKRWKSIKILLSLACGCLAYLVFTTAAWPYLMTMTHGALETNPPAFHRRNGGCRTLCGCIALSGFGHF